MVYLILVIAEGKNRNEIGFSIFDIDTQPIVYLNQIVDNFWFTDVFCKILSFDVKAIIIPDMMFNSLSMPKLLQLLSEKFPSLPHIKQNFRMYDSRKGLEQIKKFCAFEYLEQLEKSVQTK